MEIDEKIRQLEFGLQKLTGSEHWTLIRDNGKYKLFAGRWEIEGTSLDRILTEALQRLEYAKLQLLQ